MTYYRRAFLLVALLCSGPALAQRGTTTTGAAAPNRVIVSNRAVTTDWRWMTSGIRAGEALWRNFWQGDHGRVAEHGRFGRDLHANAFQRDAFGRDMRGGRSDILTGTAQRVDILTGRPID